MKTSRFPIFTLKNSPSEAEIISHKLMIQAGLVRKLSSGQYSWLPLGYKIVRKVENIIREEMEAIGAAEILMPSVQPAELWQESKRWDQYGPELLRFKDRHDREFCLAPTFEEVITDLIRKNVESYKYLPMNLFQISSKFRDEIRPRFGIIRAREFIMKDAYSFHNDAKCLDETYENYKTAYKNIFMRLMLDFTIVDADSGNIGGNESHEFHVIAETGEDDLLLDKSMNGINLEIAKKKYKEDNINVITEKYNLKHVKGIEVGHIFKLGDKYSETMNAKISNKESKTTNILMGCYGIGVTRIIAASIEQNNDDKGIVWPKSIRPFDVVIIEIDAKKNPKIKECSKILYEDLKNNGLDVLLDDRELKIGNKLNDYELIGIPYFCIIGPKEAEAGTVTFKKRCGENKLEVDIDKISEEILKE